MSIVIACYGALMEGGKFAREFDKDRKEVIPVRMSPFLMWDCSLTYPAVTWGTDFNKEYITAELHLYDNAKSVVRRMKQIEGSLYDFTKLKDVTEKIGRRKYPVWMFLYNLPVDQKIRIPHGDWKEWAKQKGIRA